MLRTRLIVGTILAALAAGMLLIDERFAPWFPFLFATIAVLATLGTLELLALLPAAIRPNRTVSLLGVLAIVSMPWTRLPANVLSAFAAMVLVAFLFEMATFREPGHSVQRLSLTVWTFAYLGVLPGFLAMLQTGREPSAIELRRGTVALALAIFVPKCCDIGAYFTGRLIGRHKMTPVLSPKKTWEGAIGGLAAAVGVAFALNRIQPVIPYGDAGVVLFGLSVGIAGMLGDLAESMIKRDCERKDASEMVPGFGGVLDVVDAILFAAPVVYWWLT